MNRPTSIHPAGTTDTPADVRSDVQVNEVEVGQTE
jgi:hypothetical protein